jgi:hypothetical protein
MWGTHIIGTARPQNSRFIPTHVGNARFNPPPLLFIRFIPTHVGNADE